MRSLTATALAALFAAGLLAATHCAQAEDATATVDPEAATGDKAMDELLAKEKEARKACKTDICSILRNHKAEGPDIGCHVVQTWPKQALDKMLARTHVSWPFSHVHCQTDVSLKRAILVDAMTKPSYEATFDPHTLNCDIEHGENGSEKYSFKVSLAPKVTFENGKATKAELHWGDVEAPMLAKGVIWPITGLDNKTGMLSGQFIAMVNQFIEKKCDEVKDGLKN